MAEFISIKTSRLSADREIQNAIKLINKCICDGASVYLYEIDNKNYCIKLKNPIGIAFADFSEIGEIVEYINGGLKNDKS